MRFVAFAGLGAGMYVTVEALMARDGVMAAVQRKCLPNRWVEGTANAKKREFKNSAYTLRALRSLGEVQNAQKSPYFRPRSESGI